MIARTAFLFAFATLAACGDDFDPLASWPEESVTFEEEVFALVNARRGEGATCGAEVFAPTHPLTVDDALERAARLHSYDMVDRDFFDHVNPDDDGPVERIAREGYEGSAWGENIAAGQATPEAVMSSWMASEGHCANIMSPDFEHIGVGLYERHWTLNFAAPR